VKNNPYPPLPNHCSANNKFFEVLFKNPDWIEYQSMYDYGQGYLCTRKKDEYYIDEKGKRVQTYKYVQCHLSFWINHTGDQNISIEISQNHFWNMYIRFSIKFSEKSTSRETCECVENFIAVVRKLLFKKITQKNIADNTPDFKINNTHITAEWINYAPG
jgi:hypothetical protein